MFDFAEGLVLDMHVHTLAKMFIAWHIFYTSTYVLLVSFVKDSS